MEAGRRRSFRGAWSLCAPLVEVLFSGLQSRFRFDLARSVWSIVVGLQIRIGYLKIPYARERIVHQNPRNSYLWWSDVCKSEQWNIPRRTTLLLCRAEL